MKNNELIPSNPPAFPMCNELGEVYQNGMTLRDYFAGKYMQANADNDNITATQLAMESYKTADAMLTQRLK